MAAYSGESQESRMRNAIFISQLTAEHATWYVATKNRHTTLHVDGVQDNVGGMGLASQWLQKQDGFLLHSWPFGANWLLIDAGFSVLCRVKIPCNTIEFHWLRIIFRFLLDIRRMVGGREEGRAGKDRGRVREREGEGEKDGVRGDDGWVQHPLVHRCSIVCFVWNIVMVVESLFLQLIKYWCPVLGKTSDLAPTPVFRNHFGPTWQMLCWCWIYLV